MLAQSNIARALSGEASLKVTTDACSLRLVDVLSQASGLAGTFNSFLSNC